MSAAGASASSFHPMRDPYEAAKEARAAERARISRTLIADVLWSNRYRLQRVTDRSNPTLENVAQEILDAMPEEL